MQDSPETPEGVAPEMPRRSSGPRRRYAAGVVSAALALTAGAALWTLSLSERRTCGERPCATRGTRPTPPLLAQLPGRQVAPDEGAASIAAPDEARRLNRAAPFFEGPIKPARPFNFVGSDLDRHRAVTCLAAAQLYEAGQGEADQKAVAQVVLNRVRHPAYPHSICAVVFEGAERATGCQFTFTCDGSLTRRYPQAAWDKARKLADRMIGGEIDPRVGWSTHYHTDWVYPYWSPSLDKLSAIGSHLFFKWRGFWGTGTAFAARYAGSEPPVRSLASLDGMTEPTAPDDALAPDKPDGDIRASLKPLADAPLPSGVAREALAGNLLKLAHPDGGSYGLLIRPGVNEEELLGVALRLCFGQNFCRVMGWDALGDIPRGFPIPPASMAALRFSYVRDPQAPRTQSRFDCTLFPNAKKDQCLQRRGDQPAG